MLKHEGLLAFGSAGVENKRGIFCSQNDFLHFFTLLSHVGFPEPPLICHALLEGIKRS